MGTAPEQTHRYAAFISYAHADEAMAARLHKALETYPVPRHLRARGKTTKPVFRDVAELTAAHSLSEKIQDAVKDSRVLIVLCSPAAKASHWVNEEIRLFRELHGDAAILSAIIEGTPATAFPDALTEGGREPLAAALGTDKAGFKLGVTQLAAGMLGTGLDDLVQRGAKRRARIMGAGLAASLALSGVMGFATWQAVEARNEAQTARGDAEGLVDFMIRDFKVKLEPLGRLSLLEDVGDKAIEYYDKQDIKKLSDKSLNRQAAARQVLAQVYLDAGRMDEALREIEAAAALTREVLARNPENEDAIFAQAQSEFWVGKYYFDQNRFAEVEPYWKEYYRLQQKLYEIDPDNMDYIMEAAYSANALGAYYDRTHDYKNARTSYSLAEKYWRIIIERMPDNPDPVSQLANVLSGQSRAALQFQSYSDVNKIRGEQMKLFKKSIAQNPDDKYHIYLFNLAKLRRHTDVLRFSKDKKSDYLDNAIQAIDELTQYEPNNKRWIETAYSAKFYQLDDYYNRKKTVEYLNYYSDFESASEAYFRIKESPSQFKSFMQEVAELRLLFLKKDIALAKRKLMALNLKNEAVIFENLENSEIDARLMLMNFEVGNDIAAEKFARKYLRYTWVISKEQTPTVLEYKSHAYTILKECDAARVSAENLKSRDFYPTTSIEMTECA